MRMQLLQTSLNTALVRLGPNPTRARNIGNEKEKKPVELLLWVSGNQNPKPN